MLVENQIIETKWSFRTKDWYISRGYIYTKDKSPLFVRVEDLPRNSSVKVKCSCDECGEIYIMTYQSYIRIIESNSPHFICKECKNKKYFNRFIDYCNSRGYIPKSTQSDYHGRKTKLKYICPIHGEHEITYDNAINNNAGCPECGLTLASKKNKNSIDNVIKIIESKNNNKLLNPEEYISARTVNLQIKCGRCGNIFKSSLNRIQNNQGLCHYCAYNQTSKKLTHNIKYVIEQIESKNNNRLLNPEDYITQKTNNLNIQCGSCGRIFTTSLASYKLNLTGKCSDCNELSYGEYLISQILDDYKITYNRQKKFQNCVDKLPLPFDFYLPDYNLYIEYDGQHHYSPIWGEDRHKITKQHDKIKNDYCRQNGIDLLRIPYWERKNLENIIRDKLGLVA